MSEINIPLPKGRTGIIGAKSWINPLRHSDYHAEFYAKKNLEISFQGELMSAISDGREYFVKVFPVTEDRQIRGYEPAIVYSRQALVALRKWQDAEVYEFVEQIGSNDNQYGHCFEVSLPVDLTWSGKAGDRVLPTPKKLKCFERATLAYGDTEYNLWQRKE